jgi:hypothetical protein
MIVTTGQLNRHLSAPTWTEEQWTDAEEILQGCEGDLEVYFGAPITPRAPVTIPNASVTDSGLVLARHPIYQVVSLDGVAITDNVLPAGWELREDERALFSLNTREAMVGYSLDPFAGYVTSRVAITYIPGWGPHPALVKAIKRKAGAIFLNRHDDTVTVRSMDGATLPPLKEEWLPEELKALNWFKWRNITR